MNRRDSIYDGFRRFWLSELGLGNRSRLGNIIHWLTLGPIRKLFRGTFAGWFGFDEPEWIQESGSVAFTERSPISWLHWVNPIYWMYWCSNFCYEWIVSRRYFSLGPAIPSVVICIAMCFVAYMSSFTKNEWRDDYYRKVLSQATRDNDDLLKRLALATLSDRDPGQVEFRVRRALLEEKMGNQEEAFEAMLLLTQEKNPTAAYWMARNSYPLEDLAQWPEGKHQQFRSLLAIALSDSSKDGVLLGSRVLMAQYLVGIGASAEAIVNLESVALENEELMLVTANLHAQLNNKERARVWSVRAEEYYRNKLLIAPADIGMRMNLARALLIQGRAEDVATTLTDGFRISKDPQLLIAGGEALAGWANEIQASQPATEENLLKRLQLVNRAVELAPQNQLVLESLIHVALQCTDAEDPKIAELRQALLGKIDADKLHFIQGTVELLRGDLEKADAHLQLAAASTSNVAGVLNNLAVVMSQKEDPDLDKALAFANAALKSAPEHPYLRETRGQIFLKMKQYNEAILDLELALPAEELRVPIHNSLAAAYEAIGLSEVAQKHIELAKQP
jgi:Flp pilus assembly protein TadD